MSLEPGYITPDAKIIGVDPSLFLPNLEEHYAKANEFFASIGSPKTVCAPMVAQSELPFRMFVRKYGCELCYTPMINSVSFLRNIKKTKDYFETAEGDRPLFAQFAGDDPELMLRAAKLIEDQVDAIDINFGCPQQIARRGHYGSFLLEETKLIQRLVRTLHDGLKVPVTVKMRVLLNDPTGEKTLALGRALQDSGASVLTLHGRTREMLKLKLAANDFDIIRRMKATLRIPVFSNGGIETMDDVKRAMEFTKVNGVMVSEALLGWPTMFAYNHHDEEPDTIDVAMGLLDVHDQHPGWEHGIRPHLFKVLFRELNTHTDIRQLLSAPRLGKDLRPVLRLLRKKQLALWEKYKADPENFDWAGEIREADVEAKVLAQMAAEKEAREAAAKENIGKIEHSGLTFVGTGQTVANPVTEPPVNWKSPDGSIGGMLFKKYKKGEVMQIEDDGKNIEVPPEAYAFIRKFYAQQKPWYTRYQGRLLTDVETKAADEEAEKSCCPAPKPSGNKGYAKVVVSDATAVEEKNCSVDEKAVEEKAVEEADDADIEQERKKQRVE